MDTDHGHSAGNKFKMHAEQIREAANGLRAQVHGLYYEGPEAEQFRSDFENTHYPNLLKVHEQANALGDHLTAKAGQFNQVGNR